LAAAEGRLDLLEVLLRGSIAADVAKVTEHGATPVYVAAQNGHAHIVKVRVPFEFVYG
jgi:ankyrin repeat protein